MGVEIKRLEVGSVPASVVVAEQRLWLTDDGELVVDGDPRARFLFCSPGDEIPVERAKAVGLVKQALPPENKQRRPERNK